MQQSLMLCALELQQSIWPFEDQSKRKSQKQKHVCQKSYHTENLHQQKTDEENLKSWVENSTVSHSIAYQKMVLFSST